MDPQFCVIATKLITVVVPDAPWRKGGGGKEGKKKKIRAAAAGHFFFQLRRGISVTLISAHTHTFIHTYVCTSKYPSTVHIYYTYIPNLLG